MPYKRIISLVPSLTELLFDLGLENEIVGRTRFCIHPSDQVSRVQIIGGTKNPNIGKIIELQPDLVIANKEENRKEDIDAISQFCEVIVTEIDTVKSAFNWIHKIGVKLNRTYESELLIDQIIKFVATSNSHPIKTAYFIWREPWMSIGNDTYIHDVMRLFGLENVFSDKTRYPETSLMELIDLNPELILLSSEPYPFKKKHVQLLTESLPSSCIMLIDGEWFSWYGSRMVHSFKELKTWRNSLSI